MRNNNTLSHILIIDFKMGERLADVFRARLDDDGIRQRELMALPLPFVVFHDWQQHNMFTGERNYVFSSSIYYRNIR